MSCFAFDSFRNAASLVLRSPSTSRSISLRRVVELVLAAVAAATSFSHSALAFAASLRALLVSLRKASASCCVRAAVDAFKSASFNSPLARSSSWFASFALTFTLMHSCSAFTRADVSCSSFSARFASSPASFKSCMASPYASSAALRRSFVCVAFRSAALCSLCNCSHSAAFSAKEAVFVFSSFVLSCRRFWASSSSLFA